MGRTRSVSVLAPCLVLAAALAAAPATSALQEPADRGGSDQVPGGRDVRTSAKAVLPTDGQLEDVRAILDAAASGTRVTYDDRFGTPRTIYPTRGGTLAGPRAGAPVHIARAWVSDHRSALGLTGPDVAELVVSGDHRLPTGTTW